MTVKEQILLKPTLVQRVIKAKMTKEALGDRDPDWDTYGQQALDWWEEEYRKVVAEAGSISETVWAEKIIAKVKGPFSDLLKKG